MGFRNHKAIDFGGGMIFPPSYGMDPPDPPDVATCEDCGRESREAVRTGLCYRCELALDYQDEGAA
jgi:hypothetical protein